MRLHYASTTLVLPQHMTLQVLEDIQNFMDQHPVEGFYPKHDLCLVGKKISLGLKRVRFLKNDVRSCASDVSFSLSLSSFRYTSIEKVLKKYRVAHTTLCWTGSSTTRSL